jgi:hypothetical protein
MYVSTHALPAGLEDWTLSSGLVSCSTVRRPLTFPMLLVSGYLFEAAGRSKPYILRQHIMECMNPFRQVVDNFLQSHGGLSDI